MKILISTPVFKPMVGGMEVLANNFAIHFTNRGHDVTLVTPIPYDQPDDAIYPIVRQPSAKAFYELVKKADLVFSNGASLYAAPWSILTGKPVVMRHTGYQVNCIDGAGWYVGRPAPLRPLPSFWFHFRYGKLSNTIRGIFKVTALSLFSRRFVAANVAISDWMKNHHPLPNQLRIHNPFPITKFATVKSSGEGTHEYDFFFLGRLISEKGVDVLLKAFATVQQAHGNQLKLCIIGDGPERKNLEALAEKLGQTERVYFAGKQTGSALLELVQQGKIAVLPSTWEEPFGGVATELLAAGKNIIVSRDGALSEIVGAAGLTFKNGESEELAEAMTQLINDPELRAKQSNFAEKRIKDFVEDDLIDDYLQLFKSILPKHT